MKGKRKRFLVFWMICFFVSFHTVAQAKEYEEPEWNWQEELSQYDLTSLDQVLEEVLPQETLTFSQLLQILIAGDSQTGWSSLAHYVEQLLWGKWNLGREVAWQVLLLGILGALFSHLAGAFPDSGVSQIGCMIIYLVASALLLQAVSGALSIATEGLGRIGRWMTAFCPVFFLVVAIQGQLTAAAMYEMAVVLIQGLQWTCQHVLLVGIRIWVLLRILEGIFAQPVWEYLIRLIGKGIKTLMRVGFGAVIGFQAVQALLLPYLDAVKGGSLWKMAAVLPGVGNGLRWAAQLALGTTALLRNAMGVGGVVVLLAATLPSLVQLLLLSVLYHGMAVLLQPISDKRIQGAVGAVGDGCMLLCKVLGTGVLLFGIFIGIVCACFGRAG